ncbi:MAG TPA: Fe-Mn family superoxide dismutase [Planctomycetota bacterium]|nr:Fe-Mn family superoxide dismutase [Planctomycetota bacterium]
MIEYALRDFSKVRGLGGIPDGLVEAHLKLYAGYVKNMNLLGQRLAQTPPGTPEFSELHRRVGFELNGMRLHELYFDALRPAGGAPGTRMKEELSRRWGSVSAWQAEFAGIGQMRGVGWAILYQDPVQGALSNHWIGLHEEGHPAGFRPILVMDVWEHAFTGMERPKYIEAFLSNVTWEAVESRLGSAAAGSRP